MANGDVPDTGDPISVPDFATQFVAALFKQFNTDVLRDTSVAAQAQGHAAKMSLAMKLSVEVATLIGQAIAAIEKPFLPVLAGFVAPMVAGMFDTEVNVEAFSDRASSEGRNAASAAIVESFMRAMTDGAPEPAEPGQDGAKRLAAAGLHATLEGWFLGAVPEMLSDILGFEGLGHFTAFTELPDEIVRTLGVGRLIRRAFQPLINATAVEPMRWFANEKYRPTKLGVSTIVRELARGKLSYDDAYTILSREGYADSYIDALINESQKFISLDDVAWATWQGILTQDDAVGILKDLGYDDQTASKHLIIQVAKRDDAINREIATAATTAFAENRIDGSDLDSYLTASIVSERERGLLKNVALAKQALMRRELTSAEAKACVLAGILPVSDYRAALERERYAPDAADALEMLLRYEQDKRASIATHAAQMAAEKAAAAKAKADAAAAKKAEIDAARAVKKLGSISELEHAVVLGTIPISRLEQVLTADFDTDTVGIYVADVEQKRAAYVAQQQKAADAAKRAAAKGLPIGTLDQAALDHVLTVDQVGAQLTARGMAAADVDVILATLRVRVTDHDAALKKRAEAATKATAKHIDLARFEQLVLRGHRTMPDYKSLLATLGYDDASQAAMAELLQLKVDAAAAAVQTRKTLAASAPVKGRALAAARRAVILGAASLDSFQTFLVAQGYTADVQATLTGELRDDVAAADAARARRAQAAGVSDAHDVPLATVTRAARLGIITPAAYQAQLTERGYTADDNALEMDLLTYELAHTKAVAKLLPTTAAIAPSKGLTLAELSRAVKTGEAAIGEFTNRALALGYSQADAQIMTAVLQDEVDTLAAAKLRHTQVDGELAARTISLSAEEKAVVDGLQTLDQYETWLTANGLGAADAQLLRALLETKLPPTTASTAGGA